MPSTHQQRPARRDALRNRARLIAVAGEAFREEGLGASVNAIAERAGVNVATLYRHFPTKEQLIVAVLEGVLEPLEEARDRALASAPADGTLAAFVAEALRHQGEHRGLVDALGRAASPEVRRGLRDRAVAIVAPIVERAHEAGELRPGLDSRDLLLALRMLTELAAAPGLEPERLEHQVEVVLRGLRPD